MLSTDYYTDNLPSPEAELRRHEAAAAKRFRDAVRRLLPAYIAACTDDEQIDAAVTALEEESDAPARADDVADAITDRFDALIEAGE